MPKIHVTAVPEHVGSRYPAPHDAPCRERRLRRLADAAGLSHFGVNLVTLAPGVWSSQRHWHSHEEELVYVLEGELVLVTDSGEETMRAGDVVGFAAGTRDGHHLQNRSGSDAVFLVVGSRDDADYGEYSDIDLKFTAGRYSGGGGLGFTKKDGTPL
jgi:uncharacterized cupin superfamily protein